MSERFDEDGYPTEAALEKIRAWPATDYLELMGFVRSIWHLASWGFEGEALPHADRSATERVVYRVSTAGWSGNESIVAALKQNRAFWALSWVSSRRGGHYVFEVLAAPAAETP